MGCRRCSEKQARDANVFEPPGICLAIRLCLVRLEESPGEQLADPAGAGADSCDAHCWLWDGELADCFVVHLSGAGGVGSSVGRRSRRKSNPGDGFVGSRASRLGVGGRCTVVIPASNYPTETST